MNSTIIHNTALILIFGCITALSCSKAAFSSTDVPIEFKDLRIVKILVDGSTPINNDEINARISNNFNDLGSCLEHSKLRTISIAINLQLSSDGKVETIKTKIKSDKGHSKTSANAPQSLKIYESCVSTTLAKTIFSASQTAKRKVSIILNYQTNSIRTTIQENIHQIQSCYNTLLQKNSKAEGLLDAVITIGITGNIASVTFAKDTIGDKNLTQCVASKISNWIFPKPRNQEPFTFSYPLSFKL